MYLEVITQIVGFFALLFTVKGFISKHRTDILIFQSVGFGLFSLHFLLLGAYSGSVMNLISVTRNFIFEKRNRKKWARSKIWFYFFLCLVSLLGFLFFKDEVSILPVFGLLLGTYGTWQNEPKKIRFFMLGAVLCWIVYTYLISSYFGLINQTVIMSSLLYSIYRYDIRKGTSN